MRELVRELSKKLEELGLLLVTAESCTGGMIASAITDLPGSSKIFERGFVTYSNEAKIELLGVSEETLDDLGAVSSETAIEMAEGALKNSKADVVLSVTGIAGPDGGSEDKPVGLVYIGFGNKEKISYLEKKYEGDRDSIRQQTAKDALNSVLEFISKR
jgi:nicotinamide-nucleotide amidase